MTRGSANRERREKQLERLLGVLSAATFLIFFQAYMVAPLIPSLGIGSLLFAGILRFGFGAALGVFSAIQLVTAVAAIPLFRNEVSSALE